MTHCVKRSNNSISNLTTSALQHSGKTFIGKTAKGFDWLGLQYNSNGHVGLGKRALTNFATKLRKLYEQAQTKPALQTGLAERVTHYVRNWCCAGESPMEGGEAPTRAHKGPLAGLLRSPCLGNILHRPIAHIMSPLSPSR
ncbi:hypothetical protein FM037_13345 [Shewanella psychropiezotolerans]|uniref:Uncharacterized protein n=1 Tax=Shewanella psychropiezotolerans TaxID=2593655 RepID=A0ABX5X270_9GAMM|nr:hypothetical protein [Shewanella psychropiezotolerans]QDO84043.1 hypothetical protein FM037_13345 [Shewanella psychropiezotolerans]